MEEGVDGGGVGGWRVAGERGGRGWRVGVDGGVDGLDGWGVDGWFGSVRSGYRTIRFGSVSVRCGKR